MGVKSRSKKKQKNTKTRAKDQCHDCPAKCCHDLVLVMNKPRTRHDIDYYKWHLQFDTVSLAISGHRWYSVFKARCMYLDDDNLCTIYDRRPEKCRRHNPPNCEHFGKWYDVMLTLPEELEDYLAKEKLRKKKRAAARRRRA